MGLPLIKYHRTFSEEVVHAVIRSHAERKSYEHELEVHLEGSQRRAFFALRTVYSRKGKPLSHAAYLTMWLGWQM